MSEGAQPSSEATNTILNAPLVEQSPQIYSPISTSTALEDDATQAAIRTPLPSTDRRRHSLPQNFLPSLWSNLSSRNASTTSLIVEPETSRVTSEGPTKNGFASPDSSAILKLEQATKAVTGGGKRTSRHRHSQSAAIPSSSTHQNSPSPSVSQPVLVKTYSGPKRQESQTRREPAIREEEEGNMEPPRLPPVDAFKFDNILKAIEPEVSNTLDAVASLCRNLRTGKGESENGHVSSGYGFLIRTRRDLDRVVEQVEGSTIAEDETIADGIGLGLSQPHGTEQAGNGTLVTLLEHISGVDALASPGPELREDNLARMQEALPKLPSPNGTRYTTSSSGGTTSSRPPPQPLRTRSERSKSLSLAFRGLPTRAVTSHQTSGMTSSSGDSFVKLQPLTFSESAHNIPSKLSPSQTDDTLTDFSSSGTLDINNSSRPASSSSKQYPLDLPAEMPKSTELPHNVASIPTDSALPPLQPPLRRGPTHARKTSLFSYLPDWFTGSSTTITERRPSSATVSGSRNSHAEERLRGILRAGPVDVRRPLGLESERRRSIHVDLQSGGNEMPDRVDKGKSIDRS
jgi:hypothetical protein